MLYRLEKLSDHIGAIVHDIDLNNLDTEEINWLNNAVTENLALFFRDQTMDPSSLYALAEKFGEPVPYPFVEGIEGFPEIVEIRKLPEETANFGGVWHSDTAYLDEPAKGAFLYGDVIPPVGGDTLFSNMYRAYDSLSEGLKTFLEPLAAINDADKDAISLTRPGQEKKGLTAEHPVIRTHPLTGRKLLFVDRAHTTRFSGWTEEESQALLDYLFTVAEDPRFCCTFNWRPGSMAFWDNRACQHYPINDYDGHLRRMLRVSLAGETPV